MHNFKMVMFIIFSVVNIYGFTLEGKWFFTKESRKDDWMEFCSDTIKSYNVSYGISDTSSFEAKGIFYFSHDTIGIAWFSATFYNGILETIDTTLTIPDSIKHQRFLLSTFQDTLIFQTTDSIRYGGFSIYRIATQVIAEMYHYGNRFKLQNNKLKTPVDLLGRSNAKSGIQAGNAFFFKNDLNQSRVFIYLPQ